MKAPPKHELPIIPTANLVDIAILLIIFYMACSHFISQTTATVAPPKAPGLTQQSEPMIVVTVDSENNVYLQGLQVAGASAVESGVQSLIRGRTRDEDRTVKFKCDANVNRAVFEPVLNAIVQAGGLLLAVGENVSQQEPSR